MSKKAFVQKLEQFKVRIANNRNEKTTFSKHVQMFFSFYFSQTLHWMFLIFVIETLSEVFFLENLMFMLGKFWIGQNLALLGPNLALFGPNLDQNVVFRLFLPNAALNVPNFCYRNFIWGLLLGKPNVYAGKILDWPKFGPFMSKFGPFCPQMAQIRPFCPLSSKPHIRFSYFLVRS